MPNEIVVVWTDERIREAMNKNTTAAEDFKLMKKMRNDYQELLTMLIEQRDQLAASLMAIDSNNRTID